MNQQNACKCIESANMLGNIGEFLPPKDSVGKMTRTSKHWSKVNLNLLYENMTPTKDPIAVFKKIDEEKLFLEDPKNLLDPAINGYNCKTNTKSPNPNFFLTISLDPISLRFGRNSIRSLDHFARIALTMIHSFRIKNSKMIEASERRV